MTPHDKQRKSQRSWAEEEEQTAGRRGGGGPPPDCKQKQQILSSFLSNFFFQDFEKWASLHTAKKTGCCQIFRNERCIFIHTAAKNGSQPSLWWGFGRKSVFRKRWTGVGHMGHPQVGIISAAWTFITMHSTLTWQKQMHFYWQELQPLRQKILEMHMWSFRLQTFASMWNEWFLKPRLNIIFYEQSDRTVMTVDSCGVSWEMAPSAWRRNKWLSRSTFCQSLVVPYHVSVSKSQKVGLWSVTANKL